MRVFVAGATGVLGRRAVRGLVEAGHQVVGASRSDKNRELLARLGAEARTCDVCDDQQTVAAAAGCQAILHLATAIPDDGRKLSAWAANDRLRTRGTRALAAAAKRHGVRLLVQSIAYLYGDRDGGPADESTPISSDLPDILHSAVDLEKITTAAARAGVAAAILRCGGFYCHDSLQTKGLVELAQAHKVRVPAGKPWYQNLIHVDDAASAFVAATAHAAAVGMGAPEIWNVVDDEPVPIADLFDHVASRVGAPRPSRVPAFLARLWLGGQIYRTISASVRVSNAKIRTQLDWRPRYPSYREGYAEILPHLVKA